MTARLILCPPTAVALDRLNDARELDGKLRTERKRHGDHTPQHRALQDAYQEACMDIVDELLRGAVYVDSEPDPRVAALEARCDRFEQLLMANWGVNGTNDITPAMARTLHYARTGEMDGEVDPWPHIVDDDGTDSEFTPDTD